MQHALSLVLLGALLTGCASNPLGAALKERVQAASGYSTGTSAPVAGNPYTPWVLTPCQLRARGADLIITTDGHLTASGALQLRVLFTGPLVRPPVAEIRGMPTIAVNVEGAQRIYNLFVPYTPESGAHYLTEAGAITLLYQPLNSADMMEISFPTRPLMLALNQLEGCAP